MQVRIGNRRFRPGLLATVLTLALIAVMIALGDWQLGRARDKEALLAAFEAGAATTTALQTAATAAPPGRYQHVRASGRYDPARQLLLDNMPSTDGRPGYHVLTPLLLDDGSVLLVNRGWVTLGRTREELPELTVTDEAREVSGRFDRLPEPGIRLGGEPAAAASWPRVLNFPKLEELRALYGPKLVGGMLLLDASAPDGYRREWRGRFGVPPERHTAYAVQWFALALALTVIYVALNFEPIETAEPGRG